MTLRPLGDHIIIKAASKEEVTASGIIIPDMGGEKRPEQGEVIAVGPGKMKEDGTRTPMDIAVGNKIVFKSYAPNEVKIGNDAFLVLSEADVLAVAEA